MTLSALQDGVTGQHSQNGGGQNAGILNSWKEISAYIGRGVRTVQRWEREFGLPVRRPGGHIRGSVIALRGEIDAWLLSRAARAATEASGETQSTDGRPDHSTQCERLRVNLAGMKKRHAT